MEVVKREDNKPKKFTIIKRGDPDYVDRTKKPRSNFNRPNSNSNSNSNSNNSSTKKE
jgi:hypothetical protein